MFPVKPFQNLSVQLAQSLTSDCVVVVDPVSETSYVLLDVSPSQSLTSSLVRVPETDADHLTKQKLCTWKHSITGIKRNEV